MRAPAALMVLGTSSGAGKSLMATSICRVLRRRGETPVPFKGQNMSNNAWVDSDGGEMAYSQALQAWAAGLEPSCLMNPVLLKPCGDSTSEVVHIGKSVGIAKAELYYEEWFKPGWRAIRQSLKELHKHYPNGHFVLEGAGSPVEMNLQRRDLTNLRLAQYLRAKCLLVADIERGGVFAQVIGTLELLRPVERRLICGVLVNRFRGRQELFDEGRRWLQQHTGVPVIGVMPWLAELFPPEDSLDLLERHNYKRDAEIEIAVVKLPFLSNFSDLDPLEAEPSVQLRWVTPGDSLGQPAAIIVPGSKQTLYDLTILQTSGLASQVQAYAKKGGTVLGICGGLQMLGQSLKDPEGLEGRNTIRESMGLNLLPLVTYFQPGKLMRQRRLSTRWPIITEVSGFELHQGRSQKINAASSEIVPLTNDDSDGLGWVLEKADYHVAGTYLHGLFDNGVWRRHWLNGIRQRRGLQKLPVNQTHYGKQRQKLLDRLADVFEEHVDIEPLL
ncbi:cobyric acid synthase [cyanobiont of Ornithocercus magnificus]|nr:cobyric acid synthase [cyanobiont of Ornithocercus magnificus]